VTYKSIRNDYLPWVINCKKLFDFRAAVFRKAATEGIAA
jgi:hypothetical protein